MKLKAQGETLKNYKKFEKALLYFDQANTIKPVQYEFWYHKGYALYEIEKYKEALDCYNEALKLKPDDPEIVFEQSKCQMKLKNFPED